jgi:hypothetical protein
VAVLLAASALAGCGADDADTVAAEPPQPVEGLLATVGTNRLYAPDHELGVGLENVGDEAMTVTGVQLVTPLYADQPMAERRVVLEPTGRRFVLPVPYGEPRCGEDVEVVFEVLVVLADSRQLRVPATEEYDGALERLHSRECGAAEVRAVADIGFGDDWHREGVAVSGEMVLDQRVEGATVAVDDAAGNVIFTLVVDAPGRPVLRVDDAEPTARVPVTISADRCDPHAVAEFKRPFVFLSWVAVGDGDPVPVELELTGAVRDALEDLLATC